MSVKLRFRGLTPDVAGTCLSVCVEVNETKSTGHQHVFSIIITILKLNNYVAIRDLLIVAITLLKSRSIYGIIHIRFFCLC